MTYDNIKQDVLSLGFTDTLEDEGQFLLALNRAQSLLASEFPKKKTLLLSRTYRKPKATFPDAFTETIALRAGESVAFLYRLFDGAVCFCNKVLPLTEGAGTYKFTAERDGILTAEGDAEMFAIAVYDDGTPLALCEVDLPYVEYEIGKYDRGVRRISLPPTTLEGRAIKGAEVEGLTVRIPKEYQGIFLLKYEKSPAEITKEGKEIEIEERLFPLFSLLVCAYLWLEDEPERAQYYMALYREGRERMKNAAISYTEPIDTDTLGWT